MVVDMTRNELTIILLHGWGSESLVLEYFSLAKNGVCVYKTCPTRFCAIFCKICLFSAKIMLGLLIFDKIQVIV